MPYRQTTGTAGLVFHVLNRGVRRTRLFDQESDYAAFLATVAWALEKIPVRLYAHCVMPNHFHLVCAPQHDGQLSEFMQLMTMTHSKRWHVARGTSGTGCVYQGRFKAFPVQTDEHFLTVCRYVERNPLRARLVSRAEEWRWSSLYDRCHNGHSLPLADWPVLRPPDWLDLVNAREPSIAAIRAAIARSRPFGDEEWVKQTATSLSLEQSLGTRKDFASSFPMWTG